MKSLFAKIFACFFLSHLLAALLVYALLTATRPERARLGARPNQAPTFQNGQRPGSTRPNTTPPNDVRPNDSRPGNLGPGGAQLNQARPSRNRRAFRGRNRIRPEHLQLIRLGAIFIAATTVAYGLALYLTTPISKLRKATHALAAGDLSTRVAPQMGKRRDELADLGQDFDVMAARIQSLLGAERRLLGDISHELRSPLARLNVALELADQTADEDTRVYLQRIEREGARLNDLIGQLLTLTRLESAALEAQREPVDLAQLVSVVADDANFEARAHNRAVRITHSDECSTTGNAELLRRAVENVVRNAVRYTRENSEIEIALRCDATPSTRQSTPAAAQDRYAIISVRDYGPGVPEEALGKLFDPFYRVADARDRESGGVGLGLSITARAVRFHGGQVQALNAEGGGLLIELRLPML